MFTGRFVPPQVIVIALFSLSQSTAFPAAKDVPKLTDDAWVQTRDLFWSSLHCLPHSRLQGSVHSNTELFRISIICSSDSPDKRKVPKYKHKHTYIVKVAMQHCENSQIKVQSNFSQTYSSFIWQINVIVGGVNVHVSWQFHRWSIIQHLSILMPNIFAMFFIPPCCLGYGTWIIYFLCLVRGGTAVTPPASSWAVRHLKCSKTVQMTAGLCEHQLFHSWADATVGFPLYFFLSVSLSVPRVLSPL